MQLNYLCQFSCNGGISGFLFSCELKSVPYHDDEVLVVESEVNHLICCTLVLLLLLLLLNRCWYIWHSVFFVATRTSLVNRQKRQKFIIPCALSNILYVKKHKCINIGIAIYVKYCNWLYVCIVVIFIQSCTHATFDIKYRSVFLSIVLSHSLTIQLYIYTYIAHIQ